MKQPLLATLFSKDKHDFVSSFVHLLKSKGFDAFTIWDVENGTMCKPIANIQGILDAVCDLYDLGYDGADSFIGEFELSYFEAVYPVYAAIFCRAGYSYNLTVTFHKPVDNKTFLWLQAIAPFVAQHVHELEANERRMDIVVDYQKKIDFIKESGQILKALSVNDVIINALNFFSVAFHSEASCVLLDKNFAAVGLTRQDLRESIFIDEITLEDYIGKHTGTFYITKNIKSSKFNISNMLLVQDSISCATFALFNISGNIIPDRELSALIIHLVSIAIENAQHHEHETLLKIEEAEMLQTVEIINKFVNREISFEGYPDLYCVNYPAKHTSGDYSSFIDDSDYTFLCVADVCGKGYSAATLTVVLATIIDSGIVHIADIGLVVNTVNAYLINKNFNDRFITGFFGVIDKKTKILRYVSCGHEPAILFRDSIHIELASKNLPMGILECEYDVHEIQLNNGDLLFIYSDGVTEYIDYNGLMDFVSSMRSLSPKEIVCTLYEQVMNNSTQQRDDFTCMAAKF